MKKFLNSTLHRLGYQLTRLPPESARASARWFSGEPASVVDDLEPVWPLPRGNPAMTDAQVRQEFDKHPLWHYGFEFDGGLRFETKHHIENALKANQKRPLQRFRHFMPYVVDACGGSLKDKRVLDIACNSGFWSIQCALLGADVVGFDARPELVEEAELVKAVVGVANAEFKTLNFWDMTPSALGGTFDVVLNLGLLYHLANPISVLERTREMCHGVVLLDTSLHRGTEPLISLTWETPRDISATAQPGIAAFPTSTAVELMLRQAGFKDWLQVPARSEDLPDDYLDGRRAAWIVHA